MAKVLLWNCISLVILNFDGSYTPPNAMSASSLKPTVPFFPFCNYFPRNFQPIASCGVAIFLKESAFSKSKLVALGGESLSSNENFHSSTLTSAHVEYEGLLLGLRWILDLLEQDANKDLFTGVDSECGLIIRGDCKTVITQLNGDSKPRKLTREFDEAVNLLQNIEKHLIEQRQGDKTREHGVVSIELIPREENKIADAVARISSYLVHQKAVLSVRSVIQNRYDEDRNKVKSSIKLHPNEKQRKKNIPSLETSSFAKVLKLIMGSKTGSLLSHEDRVAILQDVAVEAENMKDAIALAAIGGAIRLESSRIPTNIFRSRLNSNESAEMNNFERSKFAQSQWEKTKRSLEIEGITLEVGAMRLLGLEKDAQLVEKKYKHKMKSMEEFPILMGQKPVLFSNDLERSLSDVIMSIEDKNAIHFLEEWKKCAMLSENSKVWLHTIKQNQ